MRDLKPKTVIYEYERPHDLTLTVIEYEWRNTLTGIIPVNERSIETHYVVGICIHLFDGEPIEFMQRFYEREKVMEFVEDLKKNRIEFDIRRVPSCKKYSLVARKK